MYAKTMFVDVGDCNPLRGLPWQSVSNAVRYILRELDVRNRR